MAFMLLKKKASITSAYNYNVTTRHEHHQLPSPRTEKARIVGLVAQVRPSTHSQKTGRA